MNKTPRLSKSGIEYLDYVWNFYPGCKKDCSYCWARKLVKRFPKVYPNGFEPTLYEDALLSPLHLKKPRIIGVNFMGDLFGDWVDPNRTIIVNGHVPATLKAVLYHVIQARPEHTFVFLTKQPQNLPAWSPFPDNCWVGVSATDQEQYDRAWAYLRRINAKVKYISFEPLLNSISLRFRDFVYHKEKGFNERPVDWVIIGAQTKPYKPPKIEWVEEIVRACDKAGVKVFLKDNLRRAILFTEENSFRFQSIPGVPTGLKLRQELPK